MLDSINFPLGSNLENSLTIINESEFNEFYTGLKNDKLKGCSFSHHFSPIGCYSKNDLIKISNVLKSKRKILNIAFNIYYYHDNLKEEILKELDTISKLNINLLIIANLEIYYLVKKHFPKIRLAASSLFGIKNYKSAQFFLDLGFERLIFPRSIKINDALYIGNKIGKLVELEAFIYSGGCTFCESTCHLPHVVNPQLIKENGIKGLLDSAPVGICKEMVRFNKGVSNISEYRYLHPGEKICGVCYIKPMLENNISKFKVSGRSYHDIINKALHKTHERLKGCRDIKLCKAKKEYCLYGKENIHGNY